MQVLTAEVGGTVCHGEAWNMHVLTGEDGGKVPPLGGVERACSDGVGWRYSTSRGGVECECSDGVGWWYIASRGGVEHLNVQVLTV